MSTVLVVVILTCRFWYIDRVYNVGPTTKPHGNLVARIDCHQVSSAKLHLPLPGGIAISLVCWLVGLFVCLYVR